ncbi:MAG: hypothetical protein KJP05_08180, partial [Deltaproteobacteria bacterium]|nr:hypothetical protein [Deltaproteobacteria bacterium]
KKFLSESLEMQRALQTVSRALEALKQRRAVTWIMDSGFDDVAVWRTIVEIRACPVRLIYETNVRREGAGETVQKVVWLAKVRLPGTQLKPWLLLTDWLVTDVDSAIRIFQMYRERWAGVVVTTAVQQLIQL